MKSFALTLSILILLSFPFVAFAEKDDEPTWSGFKFKLENLEGKKVSEKDVFTGGEIYLVDFWASWCRPCAQYLPVLETIVDEYGDSGLKVVIFSTDEPGKVSEARNKLKGENYPFTFLFDVEQDIQSGLGVRRIPTTLIFDAEGKELWRHVGYESGDEEEVIKKIEEFLKD